MSSKTGDFSGRVHAHGGTIRKLNIMREESVRELEGIIKNLKSKRKGAKIAPYEHNV